MITKFRRFYNVVDSFFDRHTISQEMSVSQDAGAKKQPQPARQTLAMILPIVKEFDRQARLKSIVSQQGVDSGGTSVHWEFFFDLGRRQAKLVGEWILAWDDRLDNYGPARLEVTVQPFPPPGSPISQLVREGHLLHRQLAGMWRREQERYPDLPYEFHDTDVILADFSRQGLDVTLTEFSLRTGQSPEGHLCWIAQTRYETYYAVFVSGLVD